MRIKVSDRNFIFLVHSEVAGDARVVSESSKMGTYSDSEAHPGSSFLWIGEKVQLNREEAGLLARCIQYWLRNKRLPHDFALLEEVEKPAAADDFEEDFSGQRDEMRRHDAIRKAVDAADKIILEASDGSVEETDFLTTSVAYEFAGKVTATIRAKMLSYELRRREHGGESTDRNG
jgi:hypothetical protein